MLGGAELHEQLHVAHIRRLAVEDIVAEWAPPELLGHVGELGQRQPGAAVRLGHVGGPETRFAGPRPAGLKLRQDRDEALLQKSLLEGVDLLGKEIADEVGDRLNPRGRGKVHGVLLGRI